MLTVPSLCVSEQILISPSPKLVFKARVKSAIRSYLHATLVVQAASLPAAHCCHFELGLALYSGPVWSGWLTRDLSGGS